MGNNAFDYREFVHLYGVFYNLFFLLKFVKILFIFVDNL